MVWEISGDMVKIDHDEIATPLIDTVNKKIEDPNYDCSLLRDPLWALGHEDYKYSENEPDEVISDISLMSSGIVYDYGVQVVRPPNDHHYEGDVYMASDLDHHPSPFNECPVDFTGYYPVPGCEAYVYCQYGQVVGDELPCNPGTLFEVTIQVCTWANTVHCDSSEHPTRSPSH